MKKTTAEGIRLAVAAAGAWLSNKLGILYPVLWVLLAVMCIDYVTGMLASKTEALDHPGDPSYGWTSKKGAKGIIKKAGYLCVIAAAILFDYMLFAVRKEMGFTKLPASTFFGLMVTVWYICNEFLSIIENAGRMGAYVPEGLSQYISVLREKMVKIGADDDAGKVS